MISLWFLLYLLHTCLFHFQVEANFRFQSFTRRGRYNGTLGQVEWGDNKLSRSKCAERCLREGCGWFSVSNTPDLSLPYCEINKHPQQLPVGVWEFYSLPTQDFCATDIGRINFLLRTSGDVSFNRPWLDYKNGFGDPNTNFWLGLDTLHSLTAERGYGLRVDISDWNDNKFCSKYQHFRVGPEIDFYRLEISGYDSKSTAGDSLTQQVKPWDGLADGMQFSTPDKDNDRSGTSSCAVYYNSGWWYDACSFASPTGVWKTDVILSSPSGIHWLSLPGYPDYSDGTLYNFKYMAFSLILI